MRRRALSTTALSFAAPLAVTALGCGVDGDEPTREEPAASERRVRRVGWWRQEFELDPANPRIERAGRIGLSRRPLAAVAVQQRPTSSRLLDPPGFMIPAAPLVSVIAHMAYRAIVGAFAVIA